MEREPLKKENECIDFELDLTEEDYKDLTVDNYEIKHFIIKLILVLLFQDFLLFV